MIANRSLGLLTDLYELTMAYAYWKSGRHTQEAVFHLYFRSNPFGSGYTIAAGLDTAISYLNEFRFDDSDIDYLATLTGSGGKKLFERKFLTELRGMKLTCDIDAIPEGEVVFPNEPLMRITGPILETQLLETALLNCLNFQSLIATKAARVCQSAKGEPVLEFGMRRAQGVEGSVYAARGAYIGGCAGTSNTLAGKLFGIPVKGTHAHSWVMSFDTEEEAFMAYARALPHNTTFLVDTYDTLEGIDHAITAGKWLKKNGHTMSGIRLDSGDLAYLSKVARKKLDKAGLTDAKIVASNELDEHLIRSLKEQGAKIAVWGVGTKLTTCYDQPALGGVYKVSAIREPGGEWSDTLKISDQTAKISHPGIIQVRRFYNKKENIADAIFDIRYPPQSGCTIMHPTDPLRAKSISAKTKHRDLLVPVFRRGKGVYRSPKIAAIRQSTIDNLKHFHAGLKRFENPHSYPVGFEQTYLGRKKELTLRIRKNHERAAHH
ncbi:MAG: nicotinate phosphoribosyltransferase [Candidatus Omnitrophica bacterium]|nr:nicotinate phosphoribosyltransferase [Candidatus Omnitrophota bacterium]